MSLLYGLLIQESPQEVLYLKRVKKKKSRREKNKKKDNKDLLRQSLFNSFQKKHGETNR